MNAVVGRKLVTTLESITLRSVPSSPLMIDWQRITHTNKSQIACRQQALQEWDFLAICDRLTHELFDMLQTDDPIIPILYR